MHRALELPGQAMGAEQTGETFFRDLFAQAPIACFSVGVDGRVRAANRRALDLVGYQEPEIIGRPVLDLYADTAAGKTKAKRQFLLFRSGVEIRGAELEMRRAGGTSIRIRLFANPIRDRTGQVTASCSVVEAIQAYSGAAAELPQQDHAKLAFESGAETFDLTRDRASARDLTKRFLIRSSGTSYFVRMDDIDWVGAAGNYVEVHIGNKLHLLRKTMNALEAELDPRRFLRIHRSVIVNVERIKELRPWRYGDNKVVLFGGTQLTLKRCNSEKLEQLVGGPI